MSREWRLYLADAIEFCDCVTAYTAGMDRAAFESNRVIVDAVTRNVELIGEALRCVPEDVRDQHPEIPWTKIIATRHILAHAYFGVDKDILWDIVSKEVAILRRQLETIV
jgi:uncharacterized protein with HEPN domain